LVILPDGLNAIGKHQLAATIEPAPAFWTPWTDLNTIASAP